MSGFGSPQLRGADPSWISVGGRWCCAEVLIMSYNACATISC